MADADGTIERSDLILGELATLGLTLARDLHKRAMEAEDADQAVRLAMAFHHISRSVRQSLALQARLTRERRLDVVRERDDTERRETTRRDRRKAQVHAAVQRLIWTEQERPDHLDPISRLKRQIDADATDEDFLEGPAQRHIERLCKMLGLQPPAPEAAEPLPRRSSA